MVAAAQRRHKFVSQEIQYDSVAVGKSWIWRDHHRIWCRRVIKFVIDVR
jgi:hypothetical protein